MRLIVLGLLLTFASAALAADRRLVVLGFDGMDPDLVAELGPEELPHLHALMEQSGTRELATTTPAESPVSWATMITGLEPGDTGIYDFLYHARRTPEGVEPEGFGYRPRFALVEVGSMQVLPSPQRVLLGAAVAIVILLLALLFRRRRVLFVAGVALALVAGAATYAALVAWVPRELPVPLQRRGGTPFWEIAAEAGQRVRTITVPMTFPATCACAGDVKVLAGLGVPDVRGTNGTYHVWTSAVTEEEEREFGGLVRPAAIPTEGDELRLSISGPPNPLGEDRGRVETPLAMRIRDGGAELELPAGFGRTQIVTLEGGGQWSEQIAIPFAISPLVRVTGLARFYLKQCDPSGLTLYLSPMSFHPGHLPPTFPLSHPQEHAAELARAVGPFKTLGWSVDTWGYADGFLDLTRFADDLELTFAQRRALLRHELDRAGEWDVLMAVFESTDRASHMLWHHVDRDHPLHDVPEAAAGAALLHDTYRWADEVVGEVLARVEGEPNTLVLVVSDHGFASFRRGVNLNRWLLEEGYLQEEPGFGGAADMALNQLYDGADFFAGVDWSRTRAFGLGLGTLYLNRAGLDPEGVVLPSEVEPLGREIAQKLLALEDPARPGEPVVRSVAWKRENSDGTVTLMEERAGREPTEASGWGWDAPELVVGFAPGYRVSWQTCLGGIPPTVFEDNLVAWSGDHCSVDPREVAGFVAANRPLDLSEPPHVRDISPTALAWLGLEAPKPWKGRLLLRK